MHNIEHYTYSEDVDKKKVENELNSYVSHQTYQESGSGLYSRIRWIDIVCDNYSKAKQYIEDHDKGWYDQLAVKYREYPKLEPSKIMLSLEERRKNEESKKSEFAKAHSVSKLKAEYVGCQECGSKLKRTLLRSESCPLCRAELRSKTTMDTLKRYENNIQELNERIQEERLKLEQKNIAKAKIKWLVKIEYHT